MCGRKPTLSAQAEEQATLAAIAKQRAEVEAVSHRALAGRCLVHAHPALGAAVKHKRWQERY